MFNGSARAKMPKASKRACAGGDAIRLRRASLRRRRRPGIEGAARRRY
jgi:hypothetical protein